MGNKDWIPNIVEDMDIFIEFVKDTKIRIEDIEADVISLEAAPNDKNIVNSLFRQFHTIKGSASLLSIIPIAELAHNIETTMEYIRDGKVATAKDTIDKLFNAVDSLKVMLKEVEMEMEKVNNGK